MQNKSLSNKMIRQLAKINSRHFDHLQSYEEIKNTLLIRVKAAKDLFDKSEEISQVDVDVLNELNKCRYEYFKLKLDELNKRDAKSDIKSLINYFDELTDKNYKLKILQMGLEEFVRQTNEECKELSHLFLYLWKGFQKESTNQLKRTFEHANNLLNYLQKELKSSMKTVKLLEIKNKELSEQNLKHRNFIENNLELFNTASMHLIYDEYIERIKAEDKLHQYKNSVHWFLPNFSKYYESEQLELKFKFWKEKLFDFHFYEERWIPFENFETLILSDCLRIIENLKTKSPISILKEEAENHSIRLEIQIKELQDDIIPKKNLKI